MGNSGGRPASAAASEPRLSRHPGRFGAPGEDDLVAVRFERAGEKPAVLTVGRSLLTLYNPENGACKPALPTPNRPQLAKVTSNYVGVRSLA